VSNGDEYRAKAQLMREQAAMQTSPDMRADYERMAHGWEAMAKRADRRAALGVDEPAPDGD
jgi:hypothetical protein